MTIVYMLLWMDAITHWVTSVWLVATGMLIGSLLTVAWFQRAAIAKWKGWPSWLPWT